MAAKWTHDDVLDAFLDYIVDNTESMRVCEDDIFTTGDADYSKCTGAAALTGAVALTSGDFTLADGDVSGRKVTIDEQADITITGTDSARHVVLLDDSNNKVLYVNTCTSIALTTGNTVTVPSYDVAEVRDPQ